MIAKLTLQSANLCLFNNCLLHSFIVFSCWNEKSACKMASCCCFIQRMFCVLGVSSLFTKTGCDRSAVDDMLNSQEGITDHNLQQYIGIIEARANQLLLTRAFIIKHQVTNVEPIRHLFRIYLLLANQLLCS